MDNLEKYFKENKEEFDKLEPSAHLWDSISKKIIPAKKKKNYTFLKIAASLLLVIGFAVMLWIPNDQTSNLVFNDLILPSPEGKNVLLDPTKNKFTLVQFWESGNLLCNEENCYYYLPAYEKYRDLGFEIYAISLDKNKESWVQGIEENHLPWIHVSDLKGWESEICIECNISKVPTSFLLDHKGEIIAKGLNADELDETLDRLLVQN